MRHGARDRRGHRRRPDLGAGGPYAVDEGGPVELSATGNDPYGDELTYAWDLDNDGVFETPGETVAFSAADPDGPGAHTATWDWRDGSTEGTVTEFGGSGTASGSHVYGTPGVYTVTITVTDDDGGSASTSYQFVVVYDPEGAFVTGAGWIDSPAGAYAADPTLSGKATFGFQAGYKKGANVPSGNTEFQFKAGDLRFKRTSYDWLVVAGANARFKGVGSINGAGTFQVLLTATDGDLLGGGGPDGFPIKITGGDGGIVYDIKITGGDGGVVYDNKMGAGDESTDTTAIGGGSVVVHRP